MNNQSKFKNWTRFFSDTDRISSSPSPTNSSKENGARISNGMTLGN